METQTKMRIYVGGLGESVTEEDIQNTFSKTGAVEAVEFVRTKGRSFAYVDFLPYSDKSLAKLFSTYNGCAWKGGKLRLEKAKLHYLECLKCEWAEDADLASKTPDGNDAKKMDSLVEEEEALDESSQIHMYFPRLRKLKALPFKGTGKHKYSFQRIQASASPVYFCDCVEHSGNNNTIKASMKDGGVNQDEVNMINSVLNKFLNGKDAPSNHLPDDQNHNSDSTDDDNIIINAVAGPNNITSLLESMKTQTGSHSKMAGSNNLKTSGYRRFQNNSRTQKGKGRGSWRNGKLVQPEDRSFNQSRKPAHPWIDPSEQQTVSLRTNDRFADKQSIGNTSLSKSTKAGVSKSEVSLNQPNGSSNTDPNSVVPDEPTRGTSQAQKPSLAQLFKSPSNSSFSLSQILSESKTSKKSTLTSSSRRIGVKDSVEGERYLDPTIMSCLNMFYSCDTVLKCLSIVLQTFHI